MSKILLVGVVMGSESDRETMQEAIAVLRQHAISHLWETISAHREPDRMFHYAEEAEGKLSFIIAGAGGAAHLPGMLASKTRVPVLGVPIATQFMGGLDSLLSIVQMPAGVPVATFGVGKSGAANAAWFVVRALRAAAEEPV